MATAAAGDVHLDAVQKVLGHRFGNHRLLKSALGLCDDVARSWLMQVGRAAVVSVLCDVGPDRFLDVQPLALRLSMNTDTAWCLLGAVRLDFSPNEPVGRLYDVFARLFGVPVKDGNREFVRFHNALHQHSAEDIEVLLEVNPALVHRRTKNGNNTALILVLTRRKRQRIWRRMRPSDWAKIAVLLRFGADWHAQNAKGESAASVMRCFPAADVTQAEREHRLPQ